MEPYVWVIGSSIFSVYLIPLLVFYWFLHKEIKFARWCRQFSALQSEVNRFLMDQGLSLSRDELREVEAFSRRLDQVHTIFRYRKNWILNYDADDWVMYLMAANKTYQLKRTRHSGLTADWWKKLNVLTGNLYLAYIPPYILLNHINRYFLIWLAFMSLKMLLRTGIAKSPEKQNRLTKLQKQSVQIGQVLRKTLNPRFDPVIPVQT